MPTRNDEYGQGRPKVWFRVLQALFLSVTAGLVFTVLNFFSLVPQVGGNFFFSSDNPRYEDNKFLLKMFPGQSSLLLVSVSGDLGSERYLEFIRQLTGELSSIPEITEIKSLTRGPGDYEEAEESPLWRRILIGDEGRASNIIMLLKDYTDPGPVIRKIEGIIEARRGSGREFRIAGVPYIVEMIRRNLVFDLRVFSSIALVLFGITILLMFRSVTILAGTFAAAASAAAATIIMGGLAGAKVGILTANIITIVFVLTLSHVVYLTHNWLGSREKMSENDAPAAAVKKTITASMWCMMTTFLGFGSLFFVQAKPLKELGIYGLLGTLFAIVATYVFYPVFLRTARPSGQVKAESFMYSIRAALFNRTPILAGVLLVLALAVLPGLDDLNTDPSLFAFFRQDSSLRKGLEYIDSNGGSTPLSLVIRDKYGEELTETDTYEKLWRLQRDLESDDSVGSILSLPLILAEGKRTSLGALLTAEGLAQILELPIFDSISLRFITEDRMSTHFLLRMKEAGRDFKRKQVAKRLKKIVLKHDLFPEIVAGLYLLQGELSALVADSIVLGVGRLLFFFFIIALIMSRSFRISMAMIISVGVIPVMIFGVVGLLRVPVDLISAPAANIAIALGIDSMLHFVNHARRRTGGDLGANRQVWYEVQKSMWRPVVKETLIISLGFLIFTLSSFPPTRRFGLEIVFGTCMSALTTLFVLPFLARVFSKSGPSPDAA